MAYYDMGGLYDTEPSPFGSDTDYTPKGAMNWSKEHYDAALERYAALIDSLSLPVTALFGVENEQVALELASRSKGDYAVLHQTSNRLDGLDFALLYQADHFLPHGVESDYGTLLVTGELLGREVILLLCCRDEEVSRQVERVQSRHPEAPLIVMGHTGRLPHRLGLKDCLAEAERAGRGTRRSRGGWWMRDRIWVNSAWQVIRADVYARRFLFDEQNGEPLPLFEKQSHRGGWSRNLPIFFYFKPTDLEL